MMIIIRITLFIIVTSRWLRDIWVNIKSIVIMLLNVFIGWSILILLIFLRTILIGLFLLDLLLLQLV